MLNINWENLNNFQNAIVTIETNLFAGSLFS